MSGDTTVVVAEDDDDVRELVEHTLEGFYEVEGIADGTACWERLQEQPRPDAVILDVMLPGIDGAELLERIRTDERLADLPVVILTGRSREDIDIEEYDIGVTEYVGKPFSPNALRELLDDLM
ncbi:MAG: CheY-like chemotaxis protein [Natronomonas sp.]|jgi:CheY-like chemotaxis protein|uniref:response regulator n=1 Tax=Natronomonas sp. TaxID=2184060 RepID=UPI003989FCB1